MEQLIRPVSQIDSDVTALVASYANPIKDLVYSSSIRGKPIVRMPHWTKSEKGNDYQLVIFPDHTQVWVNTANIRSFKLSRFAGGNK